MRATSLLAGLATLPFISAHSDAVPGAPRVIGSRSVVANVPRNGIVERKTDDHSRARRAALQARQSTGRCGKNVGNCAAGLCCSAEGYCGTGNDYCAAPDCQITYGPACDGNKVPAGASTSTVARTKSNTKILYGGAGIYECTVPGTVAITYDDGPYIYTSHVLDLLDQYNAKATFFITGNNIGKGEIDVASNGWSDVIKRMYNGGHQVASHTWSHQDLSTITTAQLQNQIYYNEMAIRNILGVFPQYMRPPYSSCTTACQNFLASAGYHIIYFDLDTEDYLYPTPEQIIVPKMDVAGNLSTRNNPKTDDWLVIGHDIHQQTAYNLTEYMLQQFSAAGFKMVTVGDCLGDPKANWYRTSAGVNTTSSSIVSSSTRSSSASISLGTKASSATASGSVSSARSATSTSSAPSAVATKVSLDASCGGTTGQTCQGSEFGNCCSQYGWCGASTDHCGTGCQSGFGTCGSSSASSTIISGSGSASASASASVSASAPSPSSTGTLKISLDASCGGTIGQTCQGSEFGNCCSQYGWCGASADHCGTGCQSVFGTCTGTGQSSVGVSSALASSVRVSSSAVGASSAKASSSAVGVSSVALSSQARVESSTVVASSVRSSSGLVVASSSPVAPSSIRASSSPIAASSSIRPSSSPAAASSSIRASSSSSLRPSSTSSSVRPSSTALTPSTNGQCGGTTKMTCTGSRYGNCCIQTNANGAGQCYSGLVCTIYRSYCKKDFGTC